ncbi:V-type ATP synthase subunit I [Anaerococcus sp. Marseille-Q5996]|uniref:V-type ATP synthase subunit I n=1 Tax=Anaerococcus sp. Marseille-Q5996 TaxID=2972769 RepID=UPI0021C60B36|nr:V-type ATPase 116kDa subunit family protein [Anaerococcus sp. Marseille-Q5996]
MEGNQKLDNIKLANGKDYLQNRAKNIKENFKIYEKSKIHLSKSLENTSKNSYIDAELIDNDKKSNSINNNHSKKSHDPRINNYDLLDNQSYLLVYPKKVNKDLTRTINTLGFVDNQVPREINLDNIDIEIDNTKNKIEQINDEINNLMADNKNLIDSITYNIAYEKEASDYQNSMAFGEKYFYFSAIVGQSKLKNMEAIEKKYSDTNIISKDLMNDFSKKKNDDKKNDNKQTNKNEESYLLVYPEKVKKDVSRSINTLGFVDNEIPENANINSIDQEYKDVNKELLSINQQINEINRQYEDVMDNISYSLNYAQKSEELKTTMAQGDKYFYLSGWVPESEVNKFKALENKYDNTILNTKDVESISQSPPTRLKNNSLFRPFEFLVNMYGAPNYDEIDPTPFFAITYLLLYGLMFGDLGQGLVFIAIGLWLSKKNKIFGGLIKRIGISASIFGLMYGSFFGREDLIPALLIKPFDNIMTVLIASVAFGVSLMVISYLIGIYNKVSKQHNIEEGIFGKEGLAGLMMMLSFIIIVLNIVNISPIPMPVGLVLLILSIVMMIFKQPIARKLEGKKRLYEQSKGDYYVESSFSIIEALLSVFSNLVSFTRVGAFAINHVGLYMAFEVMAKLAGGGIIGFIILVLGNALIIGLEGMIVFIQGLRLEFYEMFSKYYEGNGRLFKPIGKKSNN